MREKSEAYVARYAKSDDALRLGQPGFGGNFREPSPSELLQYYAALPFQRGRGGGDHAPTLNGRETVRGTISQGWS